MRELRGSEQEAWGGTREAEAGTEHSLSFLLLCSVVRRVVGVHGIVHVDLVSCKNVCVCVLVSVCVCACSCSSRWALYFDILKPNICIVLSDLRF